MQRLISDNASTLRLAARFGVFIITGFAVLPTSVALAVGLTYVDGDIGANGGNNLAPAANISLTDDPAATNDGLWSYRSDAGVANPGDIFKSVYEASGGNNPEDAPEINQTVSGLGASTAYDVYVVYWQGEQTGHNFTIRAGFSSGNHTLFNATGPNVTYPAAVAGVPALHHEWTSAIPTNPADGQTMFFEAGRTLLLGQIGSTTSSGAGQIYGLHRRSANHRWPGFRVERRTLLVRGRRLRSGRDRRVYRTRRFQQHGRRR